MNNTSDTLLFMDEFISRYCLGLLFILGIISITLNTIIFTRKIFQNTSCVLYFLSSTYANYPVICFVIPCRLLADGFALDPATTNESFCKFREYILTVSRSLSAWFMVLASFDRFMSSSRFASFRQFCHVRIARYTIMFTTIGCLLLYLHIPILFTNRVRGDQCEAPTSTYRIINDCLYSICYIIIPALLMLLFGLLTINKGRSRRIAPAVTTLNTVKRDRNLFLMMIFSIYAFYMYDNATRYTQNLHNSGSYENRNGSISNIRE